LRQYIYYFDTGKDSIPISRKHFYNFETG